MNERITRYLSLFPEPNRKLMTAAGVFFLLSYVAEIILLFVRAYPSFPIVDVASVIALGAMAVGAFTNKRLLLSGGLVALVLCMLFSWAGWIWEGAIAARICLDLILLLLVLLLLLVPIISWTRAFPFIVAFAALAYAARRIRDVIAEYAYFGYSASEAIGYYFTDLYGICLLVSWLCLPAGLAVLSFSLVGKAERHEVSVESATASEDSHAAKRGRGVGVAAVIAPAIFAMALGLWMAIDPLDANGSSSEYSPSPATTERTASEPEPVVVSTEPRNSPLYVYVRTSETDDGGIMWHFTFRSHCNRPIRRIDIAWSAYDEDGNVLTDPITGADVFKKEWELTWPTLGPEETLDEKTVSDFVFTNPDYHSTKLRMIAVTFADGDREQLVLDNTWRYYSNVLGDFGDISPEM